VLCERKEARLELVLDRDQSRKPIANVDESIELVVDPKTLDRTARQTNRSQDLVTAQAAGQFLKETQGNVESAGFMV
jgi:cell division FtsZ-interacting protein ZapD